MITWINLHKFVCMNIHEKTCNVRLYGHIITALCLILFIQNTTSHCHGTEYKFSSFFNRIAWHQIYHFIIKVQCVKIGNMLSEVIKQWRSQVIIQVTWEKEVVFIFDDIINTKYTKAKFQRDGIEPTRFNTKRENPTSKFCQRWSMRPINNTFNMTFTLTMTLTFNFQGQVLNLLYRLNSRPQMWSMGLTLTKTFTFEFWRSNVTLTFGHTHDLDHGFSWIYQIVTGVTSVVGVPSTHLVIMMKHLGKTTNRTSYFIRMYNWENWPCFKKLDNI